MGFDASAAEEAAEAQIEQNKAEIEQKRQQLFDERIRIVKGTTAASWEPTYNSFNQDGGKQKS